MAEKDVVLRVKTVVSGDPGAPLKQVAQAARQAAEEIRKLDEARSQRALREMAARAAGGPNYGGPSYGQWWQPGAAGGLPPGTPTVLMHGLGVPKTQLDMAGAAAAAGAAPPAYKSFTQILQEQMAQQGAGVPSGTAAPRTPTQIADDLRRRHGEVLAQQEASQTRRLNEQLRRQRAAQEKRQRHQGEMEAVHEAKEAVAAGQWLRQQRAKAQQQQQRQQQQQEKEEARRRHLGELEAVAEARKAKEIGDAIRRQQEQQRQAEERARQQAQREAERQRRARGEITEQEYQTMLRRRVNQHRTQERLKEDLAAQGIGGPAAPNRLGHFLGYAGGHAIAGLLPGQMGFMGSMMIGSALGPAGAAVGAGAMGLQAITAGADKLAQAMEIAGNSTLTLAQKNEALVQVMVPVLEPWFKLRDAINGVTDTLRQLHRQHAIAGIEQEGAFALKQLSLTGGIPGGRAGRGMRRLFRYHLGLEEAGVTPWQPGDFASAESFREAQKMRPLQDAILRAEAHRKAAAQGLREEEGKLRELERDRDFARQAKDTAIARANEARDRANNPAALAESGKQTRVGRRFERFFPGGLQGAGNAIAGLGAAFGLGGILGVSAEDRQGAASLISGAAGKSKEDLTRTGLEALREINGFLKENQLVEMQTNRVREAGINLAQQEAALAKTKLELQKQQVRQLAEQEREMSKGAQALGMMRPWEQRMAIRGLEQLHRTGDPNKVPRFLLQHAQRIAPHAVARFAERAGEQSAAFRRMQELGDLAGGTIAQKRQEYAKADVAVKIQMNLDEDKLAERIAGYMKSAFEKLEVKIKADIEGNKNKEAMEHQVRNANQGAMHAQ